MLKKALGTKVWIKIPRNIREPPTEAITISIVDIFPEVITVAFSSNFTPVIGSSAQNSTGSGLRRVQFRKC